MATSKELKRQEGEQGLAPASFMAAPRFEVIEKEGNLVVRGELPGLEQKDVKINVEDGALSIQGEKRSEHEETRQGWFSSERSYSSFQRRIPLPDDVEASSCNVTFEDGILEVTLKKRQ